MSQLLLRPSTILLLELIFLCIFLSYSSANFTIQAGATEMLTRCSPVDTLYEGAILKARLIFPEVSSSASICISLAEMSQEFPLLPPRMVFDTEMWHPNGQYRNKGYKSELKLCSVYYRG